MLAAERRANHVDYEREADDLLDGAHGREVAPTEDLETPEPAGSDSPGAPRAGTCDTLAVYLEEVRRRRPSANGAGRCCCTPRPVAAEPVAAEPVAAVPVAAEPVAAGTGRQSARACFEAHRGAIAEGHLGLVVRVARPYRRLGLPLEDLIQEGNLGLLAAVRGFDPDRGVPFATYATGWIRQAICRAISIKSRTIRIPLEVLGLRRRAASALSDLEQEAQNAALRSGRYEAPTVDDCARRIGVSQQVLSATIRRLPDVQSLDAPITPGGDPLLSRLAGAAEPSPVDSVSAAERRSRIGEVLGELPERDQLVVRRYYGLDGKGTASFAEIGRELHLCRERVRQLLGAALARLRRDPRMAASVS